MRTLLHWTPEDKNIVSAAIERFKRPDSQTVDYKRWATEDQPNFDALTTSKNRNLRQLQNFVSLVRLKEGKRLMSFPNRRKKYKLIRPKTAPIQEIANSLPKIGIKQKYECIVCPNCLANIRAATVGLNLVIDSDSLKR